MKHKNVPSPLEQRFRQQLLKLWPALKGSLALVHKPCSRPNCPACARGRHAAALTGTALGLQE